MRKLLIAAALLGAASHGAAHAANLTACSPLGGGYNAPPDEVIALCNKQINSKKLRGSDLAYAYDVRGNAMRIKKNFDAAIADYTEAIKLDPTSGSFLVSRALVYRLKHDMAASFADYSAAIKVDPKNDSLYQNRAQAYMMDGNFDAAIADYAEARRLKPDNKFILLFQSWSYAAKGDYAHATENVNQIVNGENGSDWSHLLYRGWMYSATGDYDRAIADYDAIVRLIPDKPRGYLERGTIYFQAGKIDAAEADLARAVALNPNFSKSVLMNYIVRARQGSASTAEIEAAAGVIESRNQTGIDLDIYNLFLGRKTPEALLAQAATLQGQGLAVCNIRAYVGEWYLLHGDRNAANANFEAAASDSACGRWTADAGMVPLMKAELRGLPNPSLPETIQAAQPPASVQAAVEPAQPKSNPEPKSNPAPVAPYNAGHRVALVIGNSKYRNVPPLANPEHDAEMVADTLRKVGFEKVILLENLEKDAMTTALRNFAVDAEKADWAVIYYAGHGMEVGGVNYLIPVDARLASDRDISFEAVPLDQVLNSAERAEKLRLVILDACRDNPFKSKMKRTIAVASRSVAFGLAPVEPDAGTLVVYAAKGGEQASDGAGEHGPFATAFVKDVAIPGLEVRRLFDFVRDDVLEATHHEQQPFSYGSISGRQDFFFVGPSVKSSN